MHRAGSHRPLAGQIRSLTAAARQTGQIQYNTVVLELNANNVIDYLRQVRVLSGNEITSARALGWGVSNVVLRVDAPGRSLVVKQSRAQLRTREEWFSNLDRVFREMEV